jgi:hypothetical protein
LFATEWQKKQRTAAMTALQQLRQPVSRTSSQSSDSAMNFVTDINENGNESSDEKHNDNNQDASGQLADRRRYIVPLESCFVVWMHDQHWNCSLG